VRSDNAVFSLTVRTTETPVSNTTITWDGIVFATAGRGLRLNDARYGRTDRERGGRQVVWSEGQTRVSYSRR
jgi:hypothetical protein